MTMTEEPSTQVSFKDWVRLQPGCDAPSRGSYDTRIADADGLRVPFRYSPNWNVLFISQEHFWVAQLTAARKHIFPKLFPASSGIHIDTPTLVPVAFADMQRWYDDILLRRESMLDMLHAGWSNKAPLAQLTLTGLHIAIGMLEPDDCKVVSWAHLADVPFADFGNITLKDRRGDLLKIVPLMPYMGVVFQQTGGISLPELATLLDFPKVWSNYNKSLLCMPSVRDPQLVFEHAVADMDVNRATLSVAANTIHAQVRARPKWLGRLSVAQPCDGVPIISTYSLQDGRNALAMASETEKSPSIILL